MSVSDNKLALQLRNNGSYENLEYDPRKWYYCDVISLRGEEEI